MKKKTSLAIGILIVSLAVLACSSSAPTQAVPPIQADTPAAPGVETATAAATPRPTPTPTAIPVASPEPTTAPPQLEIVQSQAWADRDGNVRANVLVHNPFDYPVGFRANSHANVMDGAGKSLRDQELYFLDGISGGAGFILPGEQIAATVCFTCETAPLTGEWHSVEFKFLVKDASGSWDYFTDVEASIGNVSFSGDSPIFDVSGTVKNNSASALDRISVRVFVFDQAGKLVGAAEASAWDVAPGATVNFDSYGIGQAPEGPIHYEVNALGVKY
jgi:hypothetical protein